MPSFIKIVLAIKKLTSISRARLIFWRRPISCTAFLRNLMQASDFGGTFDQLFLCIFLWNFHRRCLFTFSIPWCKKEKNDQKLKLRGPALNWSSNGNKNDRCTLDSSLKIERRILEVTLRKLVTVANRNVGRFIAGVRISASIDSLWCSESFS